MKYQSLVAEVFRKPWAILPERLKAITDLLVSRARGDVTDEQIRAQFDAANRPGAKSSGSVAVIPIHGAITPHASLFTMLFGGTALDSATF